MTTTKQIRSRRPIFAVFLAVTIGVTALAACSSDSTKASTSGSASSGAQSSASQALTKGNPIEIGMVIPQTGAAAALGREWERGGKLAVSIINDAGGVAIGNQSHDFKLTVLDDESTPAGAQKAVQQLVTSNVRYFLGPNLSANFDVAAGLFRDQGTFEKQLIFTQASTAQKLLGTAEGALIFRSQAQNTGPGGVIEALVKEVVAQNHPTKAAILMSQDATGALFVPEFNNLLNAAGVSVVYSQQFDPATRDFAPFVSAIRDSGADVVIGPYLDSQMTPFLDQAAQTGFTGPLFVGGVGATLASVGKHTDKIRFVWSPVPRDVTSTTDTKVAEFRAAYKTTFGDEPPGNAGQALLMFDPLLMLAQSMSDAASSDDLTAVAAKLLKVTNAVHTVLNIKYDQTHQGRYPVQVSSESGGTITSKDVGG